jgi:hypothetical protein
MRANIQVYTKSVFESATSVVMGAITSALHWGIREPVPEAIGGIDSAQVSSKQLLLQPRTGKTFRRAQRENIRRLKKEYVTRIKMVEEKRRREKNKLTTEIKQLKKNLRALKPVNTRLQRSRKARMPAEKNHRNDLHDAEMQIKELRHAREKKILSERNKQLKKDLRILKMSNTRLRRDLDTKVKTEEKLRKELQAIKSRVIADNI